MSLNQKKKEDMYACFLALKLKLEIVICFHSFGIDRKLEEEKLNQAMNKYNEDMNDYIFNKSVESLNSALEQIIKVINPSHNTLRQLKNDEFFIEHDEDTDEFIVYNEILSINNQEIHEINTETTVVETVDVAVDENLQFDDPPPAINPLQVAPPIPPSKNDTK